MSEVISRSSLYVDEAIRRIYEGGKHYDELPVAHSKVVSGRFGVGVYVDVSCLDNPRRTFIGFAVKRSEIMSVFRTEGKALHSTSAEHEAVRMAKKMYPGWPVFCDCIQTARELKATYINRNHNKDAHNAARKTQCYIPCAELDRLVETVLEKSPSAMLMWK